MSDEFDEAFDEIDEEQPQDEIEKDEIEEEPETEIAEELETEGGDLEEDESELPDKQEDQDDDPVEAIRKERDLWMQRYRSDEGRFNAAKRELEEIRKTLPERKSIVEALSDDEKFKELEEDFPDIAEVLKRQASRTREEILKELAPTVQQLKAQAEAQERAAQERTRAEEMSRLNSLSPGWDEKVKSEDFKKWLDRSPAYKRDIILNSENAREVASVFDDYDRDVQLAQREAKANGIKAKRKNNLEQSTTVAPKRGGIAVDSLPNDFDAVFDAIT